MKKQIGFLCISLLVVALFATACDTGPKLQPEIFGSKRGGFKYQVPVGYEYEQESSYVWIQAPGADTDTKPFFELYSMFSGGVENECESLEDLQAMMEYSDESVHNSTPKSIKVSGYPGLETDFTYNNGNEMTGKMVVVYISPTHQFIMWGEGNPDLWKNEIPAFYKILGSVKLYD